MELVPLVLKGKKTGGEPEILSWGGSLKKGHTLIRRFTSSLPEFVNFTHFLGLDHFSGKQNVGHLFGRIALKCMFSTGFVWVDVSPWFSSSEASLLVR